MDTEVLRSIPLKSEVKLRLNRFAFGGSDDLVRIVGVHVLVTSVWHIVTSVPLDGRNSRPNRKSRATSLTERGHRRFRNQSIDQPVSFICFPNLQDLSS